VSKIDVTLDEYELRAVLSLVGPAVSEQQNRGLSKQTPLYTAERALDSALLAIEEREPPDGYRGDGVFADNH
jgi:hypothetical protein